MLNKKQLLFVLPLVATLSLHAKDPFFNDPFGDNIFKEMMQMQDNMDKMFERMHHRIEQRTSGQLAPLGTYKIQDQSHFIDKGSMYEYVTNIPESKENQIDIHSENGIVSINAKIIQKQEVKTAHGYSSSSSMRMFQQKLALPKHADEKTLDMGYKDGYLVLTIQKKPSKHENLNSKDIKQKNLEQKKIKKEEGTQEGNKTKKIQLTDQTSMS